MRFGNSTTTKNNSISVPVVLCLLISVCFFADNSLGQTPPSQSQIAGYGGLHRAAQHDDAAEIRKLVAAGANLEKRDSAGRTALHVAAFASAYRGVRALVGAGADINALESDRYDVLTIAAVANDLKMVNLALNLGANPKAITSRYDGTALIAAAHLGHARVVDALIRAGAPLDHVNNIDMTALIEAVVLGNGGKAHQDTVRVLVAAGADKSIRGGLGFTALELAKSRKFKEIIEILQ